MLSPAWPALGYANGIATYVHHMRKELLQQGHRVSVFTDYVREAGDPDVYQMRDSRWSRWGRRLREMTGTASPDPVFEWGLTVASNLNAVHRRHRIDVVEMEESFGWFADVQQRVDFPVVVKLHGPAFLSLVEEELQTPTARFKIAAEGRAFKKTRHVISPSAITMQQTLEYYSLPPGTGRVIVNPIERAADAPMWRQEACNPKSILFVGRFDKRKGGDFLLLAFRRLLDLDPEYTLTFVGPDHGVTTENGPMKIQQFLDANLSPKQRSAVNYTGPLKPQQIVALRAQAGVVVVCSRWDNQPNTALEAMLQGCPVVAVDSGGVSEVVRHGETGWLSRNGDIEDFCNKILGLRDDPQTTRTVAQHGERSVREAHAAAKLSRDTVAYYEECIRAHRR